MKPIEEYEEAAYEVALLTYLTAFSGLMYKVQNLDEYKFAERTFRRQAYAAYKNFMDDLKLPLSANFKFYP